MKPGHLYAAFAFFRERGDRAYWLLIAKSEMRVAGETTKVPGGRSIAKNAWIIEAQRYECTSDDQGRKSYKLLDGIAHVPIGSLVQEDTLTWQHEGRSGGQSILSRESHLALMSHNYSNVQ